ncbi:MAG: phosphoheptose isomerase [Pseudonocardiales bacterium]|nr:SIS domain-containing protein [Actinomycetota bacterium]PZS19579.1 MAG: phosphoheptose isomerase [Pseudonocardiales bacterium]
MSGVESLYPFLYSGVSDVEAVLADVCRSTTEKTEEITRLRADVLKLYRDQLMECASAMARSFAAGGQLFTFGNGGSSTDAQAIAELFQNPGPGARPLPAAALATDVAVLSALANDVSFDVVFARPLAANGRAGDIAVGLSTSGGSTNVLRGFEEANRRGMLTIGLAGYDGGNMAEANTIDHLFVMPSSSVHRIQEAQTTTYHVLWELTQLALSSN